MKKIESFDMTLVCENGKYTLNGCKQFPTIDMFEETADNMEGLGLGEMKNVVIEKIKWREE